MDGVIILHLVLLVVPLKLKLPPALSVGVAVIGGQPAAFQLGDDLNWMVDMLVRISCVVGRQCMSIKHDKRDSF